MRKRTSTPVWAASYLILATVACGSSASASAQDLDNQSTEPQANEPAVEETIIVTGSRLGRTAFNSPTPVNVLGEERMDDLAITNVADALNQLPAFRPITSPSTNNFRASSNIAARTLDLRGLGSTRTLTLIDGRRTVPSTEEGRFDLNSVPSILVQRSEVVTGGASAAYGADAVAGVVNLILDTRMTGVKGEASYGISEYGDAERVNFGAALGTTFADGRGHLVIGGEYADENGIGGASERDWSAKFHGFIGNPFWNADPALSNGQPQNLAADNVLFAINPGGVVTAAGPLQGLQFNNQGNLVPFQFGDAFNPARPGIQMIGGDPSVQDLYGCDGCGLFVANSHISTLGHLEFEMNSAITFKAELAYSRVTGGPSHGSTSLNYGTTAPIIIKRDNPFLTPQAQAVMDEAGVTSFPIGRSHQELGQASYISRNKTWRGMLGLEGALDNDWSWDVYYSYGRTNGRLVGTNIRREDRWNQAIDPVMAPAGIDGIPAGTIVCRSSLTDPGNDCVPANVLGPGMISDAVVNWVMGDIWQTRKFEQHAAAVNLRGTLVRNWAGDVNFATGAEYRSDHSEGEQDPLSGSGTIAFVNSTPLPAMTQKVKEAYVELGVPVLADTGAGSLNVDGALRYTDYSLSGSAWTWKIGAVWDVTNALMLRVTRSRDIRAPNALELNPNTTSQRFPLNDPKLGFAYEIPSFFGGNPDLRLEKADTFTAGAVLQPGFAPDFRLSVDYYDIKVNDAIDTISNALAILLCRQGNTDVCTIGPDDRITELRSTYQNVNTLRARGFEGIASYRLGLGDESAINVNLNANYVTKLETQLPDGSVRNFLGVTGNAGAITNIVGVPRWRADAVITYENPLFSLTAHGRYIPSALLSRDYIGPGEAGYSVNWVPTAADPRQSINDNSIDSRFYLDLGARVKIYGEGDQRIELFGGIDNVFDKEPPSNLRFLGNGLYFDPVGRYYKMGIRVEM